MCKNIHPVLNNMPDEEIDAVFDSDLVGFYARILDKMTYAYELQKSYLSMQRTEMRLLKQQMAKLKHTMDTQNRLINMQIEELRKKDQYIECLKSSLNK